MEDVQNSKDLKDRLQGCEREGTELKRQQEEMYDALQGHLEKHEVLNQQELDLKRKLDALKARKDEWQAMTLTLNKKKEDLATKIE